MTSPGGGAIQDGDVGDGPGGQASALTREEVDFLRQELGADLQLLGVLGRGRAATVYLARETRLDRLVAVKVLARDLSDDPVAKARFEREAKASASLQHPNAVTVYRSGILSNHVPFQIMQYVKGGTLEDRLAAEGPLREAEARRILAEVADALASAHRSGFVHRDLRPANILCDGETRRALVSDFGLAGILPHARGTDPRLTGMGEILSSPRYASPELLRGEDPCEGTDIYALGVMAFEILTGEGPFPAGSSRELAVAHLRRTPQPLRSLRPDVSPAVAELLERCLAKEAKKRPTAAFLAEALRGGTVKLAPEPPEPTGLVQSLLQRRLPQVVVVTAGVGWAVQDFVGNQVDIAGVPGKWYGFTWATVVAAVAASSVIAWFHGKKGKQRVPPLEVLLLALIALTWAGAGFLILVR